MSNHPVRLTKADTVALWHAVDDMAIMVKEVRKDPTFSAEIKEAAEVRLRAARQALVKVNKIRRAQP